MKHQFHIDQMFEQIINQVIQIIHNLIHHLNRLQQVDQKRPIHLVIIRLV